MIAALVAADIQARCARMLAEIAAMQAENQERASAGHAAAYGPDAFRDLVVTYGLCHNELHDLFIGAT